ncbi:hypothetical protein CEXT_65491 [Caerostris extrusa]|uniref:Uncharacterized protein n=1 Tax=Caerostris extrusa TaxID=172846 RepID=A0AAV4V2V3_CAEEX|nr:hypothetical protein CEXT_65491 [Caerostris extrusa]
MRNQPLTLVIDLIQSEGRCVDRKCKKSPELTPFAQEQVISGFKIPKRLEIEKRVKKMKDHQKASLELIDYSSACKTFHNGRPIYRPAVLDDFQTVTKKSGRRV